MDGSVKEATPDFDAMSLDELVKEYNKFSVAPRKSKWATKALGVAAVKRAYAEAVQAGTADKPVKEKKAAKAPKEKAAKAPKEKKAVKAKKAKAVVGRIAFQDLIHVITENKENPRREGTNAYRIFEVIKSIDGKSKAEYMKKFELKANADLVGTASQWLWNTLRDGWIEVEHVAED